MPVTRLLVTLLGLINFVIALLISIFSLTFYLYVLALFHSCCSHVKVLWTTLVHEFHIYYGHIEWNLPFSLCDYTEYFWSHSEVKLKYDLICMCISSA